MFKRRTPQSYFQIVARIFWPRGGWGRASRYVVYRIQRLPDPAYKISRGIAAGVFTSFTPFYGLHFLISAGIAFVIRGNVLASLLATFVGNPLTFPIIATLSVELGARILGHDPVPLPQIVSHFSFASLELWKNLAAVFSPAPVVWEHLPVFLNNVFWPYLVGGIGPGLIAAILSYVLSRPLIAAYQRARVRRLKKRFDTTLGSG